MRGRELTNVAECSGSEVAIQSKQQEIGDGGFIQFRRDLEREPQAFECVAEKKKLAQITVVEGAHAQLIVRAEESFSRHVPNRKCEVAAQLPQAVFTPGKIRPQDQLVMCRWDIGATARNIKRIELPF